MQPERQWANSVDSPCKLDLESEVLGQSACWPLLWASRRELKSSQLMILCSSGRPNHRRTTRRCRQIPQVHRLLLQAVAALQSGDRSGTQFFLEVSPARVSGILAGVQTLLSAAHNPRANAPKQYRIPLICHTSSESEWACWPFPTRHRPPTSGPPAKHHE
jgi:hypothetical protein